MTGLALIRLLGHEPSSGGLACRCPCVTETGPGDEGPFHRASERAYELNQKGRDLYRSRRWEDARGRYREALAIDPTFLGPRLNIACAYTQEGRFAEAVQEGTALLEQAYVPGAQMIREAADLAPLRSRREMTVLDAAIARAGERWGHALAESVFFIARSGAPVRLPGEGVLYLGLNQEIYAWLPATGAYRRVTAEEGRVLAFVRSRDGRHVAYLRAGKLVRRREGDVLRGLTVRRLDLASMSLSPPVPIEGDAERVELSFPKAGSEPQILLKQGGNPSAFLFVGDALQPIGRAQPPDRAPIAVTPEGVLARIAVTTTVPCALSAHDSTTANRRTIEIRRRGGKSILLPGPWGAGLSGLPFPLTPK